MGCQVPVAYDCRMRRTSHPYFQLSAIAGLSLCTLLLVGCISPEPMGELPFANAPAISQKDVQDYGTHEPWWTSFNDNQLNQRINHALTNNFTLVSAWERLNAANAILKRERSGLFPALDGSAGVELQDGNEDDDNDLELSLGLEASYEVDLWGRIQSRVHAENFRAAASAANYQAVAITLSSEVALT